MIYIASPYSHPDESVRVERYRAVHKFTARLMTRGLICFSPIVYGHEFTSRQNLPGDHDWWMDFNEHMLSASERVYIYQLAGWEESLGVAHEIKWAKTAGRPIHYIEPQYENL